MPEIFVAVAGAARLNRLTKKVWLELEDADLQEITVEIDLPSLRLLIGQLDKQENAASSPPENDPLPLGGRYWVTAHTTSKTQSGVRLTIHLESKTGAREVFLDLSPQEASALADDLLEKASS